MLNRSPLRSLRLLWLTPVWLVVALGAGPCTTAIGPEDFTFLAPMDRMLLPPGARDVSLVAPSFSDRDSLVVELDGIDVTGAFAFAPGLRTASAQLDLGPGAHLLEARIQREPSFLGVARAELRLEVVALEDPDRCEILNAVECVLPFPSSRFQRGDATSDTGVRMAYPEGSLPAIVAGDIGTLFGGGAPSPLRPDPFNRRDGVSPGAQPIFHIPGGVDLEASGAPRLLEATRNFDRRSLDPDSPTVLLDATTGERLLHFVENDVLATGEFSARQATILRPAQNLLPGHRYVVAVRRLVAPDGGDAVPEPVFAALRDQRPSAIPALEARRPHFEGVVFPALAAAGVEREDLVLAFDFVVASERDLTAEMLAMRDAAFAWLATQAPRDVITVESVEQISDCSQPGDVAWRDVRGTFRVPNFLTSDRTANPPPAADPVGNPNQIGTLALDADGVPVQTGFVEAPFGIGIPCGALARPFPALLLGHGLFGSGPEFASQVLEGLGAQFPDLIASGVFPPGTRFEYIPAATNWSGLSELEVPPIPSNLPDDISEIFADPELLQQVIALISSFIGTLFLDFDQFEAMPDRLRQGQLHTLVLARLLSTGAFNEDPCFQVLDPAPVDCRTVEVGNPALGVIDAVEETYYFGASLGGIMGLMFAALTPDVNQVATSVPGTNFSILLQRSRLFSVFQQILDVVNSDPLRQLVGLQLLSELWTRGESVGYLHHVTGNNLPPLPGANAKNVLLGVAQHDTIVSPLAAQLAAATLGIANGTGSVVSELPSIDDAATPLASAHVVYDTASFVAGLDDEFLPPLANTTPARSLDRCEPHGRQAFIPASLLQLTQFLQPGGLVVNFCTDDGVCNASEPREIPNGESERCRPEVQQ